MATGVHEHDAGDGFVASVVGVVEAFEERLACRVVEREGGADVVIRGACTTDRHRPDPRPSMATQPNASEMDDMDVDNGL